MAQTESGNYYYVESNSLNDELTNFAVYEDSNDDLVFHDQSESEEPKYVAGSGFDVPSSRGYQVDGTQVVGSQESSLTAADGSTVDGTYGTEERDVIQNLVTRQSEIETALSNHGLIA
jgi:hypothetical protein